jgi:hypothetical protein
VRVVGTDPPYCIGAARRGPSIRAAPALAGASGHLRQMT